MGYLDRYINLKGNEIKMKNSTISVFIVVLVLIVGGFVFVNGNKGITGNTVINSGQTSGSVQEAILSQSGYNYRDVTVSAGKPIVLSADNSVSGCLRSVVFNIDGKKYSKYLKTPQDTIELPALLKGTYNFACSMGMGYGKIIAK